MAENDRRREWAEACRGVRDGLRALEWAMRGVVIHRQDGTRGDNDG